MQIGTALAILRAGNYVRRAGWNRKGMYLLLVRPSEGRLAPPYVVLVTADGARVPWTCSQTDLLADDWEEYPEPAAS